MITFLSNLPWTMDTASEHTVLKTLSTLVGLVVLRLSDYWVRNIHASNRSQIDLWQYTTFSTLSTPTDIWNSTLKLLSSFNYWNYS